MDVEGSQSSESQLKQILNSEKLRYVMQSSPFTVAAGSPVREAIEGIRTHPNNYALVLSGKTLAGIFTERDYLVKLAGMDVSLDRPVDEFMSKEPKSLSPDHTVADALRLIVEGGYRHVPVVDNGEVTGVISALDIVKYIAELYPTEVYNLPPRLHQIMNRAEGG